MQYTLKKYQETLHKSKHWHKHNLFFTVCEFSVFLYFFYNSFIPSFLNFYILQGIVFLSYQGVLLFSEMKKEKNNFYNNNNKIHVCHTTATFLDYRYIKCSV